MNIVLIGSDKNLNRFLPDTIFNVDYFQDIQMAAEQSVLQKSDALILDLSGYNDNKVIPLNSMLQKLDIPVIVLVNGDGEEAKNSGIRKDSFYYLSKKQFNSKNLCQLLFSTAVSEELKKGHLTHQYDFCELLFKNFPLGIFLLNHEKRIVYCNTRAEKILTVSNYQPGSYFLTQFLYPDDIPDYIDNINKLISRKEHNIVWDCRFLNSNGESCWKRIYMSAMAVEDKKLLHFLILTNDISSEKEKEAILHVIQKTIEEANKAKIDFLANISHEIRTPIHTIVGMTELLLDTNLNKEQKKYIKQIRFSSETLLSLINHILDFSRIESGQFEVEPIEFNLYRMIENSIDLIIQDINKKPVEMILFIDSNVPELIKGDPVHLHQIIRNLLNNAVKFTEEGEIFLSVTRVKEQDDKIVLGFSLKDTGIGIDEKKLRDIFNPFFQIDSSHTREYMGTGVGLSIVKKIVDLLNGEIRVESRKGAGSHFYFEIPFEEYKDILVDTNTKNRPFSGTRVLLVDDNRRVVEVLNEYLGGWGCTVQEISLDQLLKAVETNRAAELLQGFDVGFVDLKTNDMNLIQKLATDIGLDKNRVTTRLVLLKPTGMFRYRDTARLLKWFDNFLSKPVRRRDLFDCMNKLLQSSMIINQVVPEDINEKAVVKTSHKAKILVVEDHEVNREFFCTILNKLGYEAVKANNGLDALRVSEGETFDLIFMDIQMPEMDGYEATRQFRKKGITIPIIAVTANTVRGEIARCLKAGMDDYLAKPFRKSDLVPLINKWLKTGNTLEENPGIAEPSAEDLSIFNFEKAVEMFMGQKGVVLKLLNPFIERLEEQIRNMKQALDIKDFLTIQHEAHTIKGGALNIQATEMGTCALELEIQAREKEEEKLAGKLAELEQTYLRFKTAVAAVLKNNP